jgi:putative ABC transport system substrate-binding protein
MHFDQLKRREFITLLGGAAVAWPLAARAQRPAMPVIGFLGGGSSDSLLRPIAAFSQALKEAHYLERQNVAIEYRWADGDYDRLPVLATDLVQRDVRVILGSGNAAAHTAWTVSQTTPIVFVTGDDPVATGLVPGINRPGGNLTGITMMAGSLQTKRLQLLHELIPAITTFAFLVNSANANAEGDTRDAETAARILGLSLIAVKTPGQGDLDAVFETIAQKAVKGIVVNTDSAFLSRRKQIAI